MLEDKLNEAMRTRGMTSHGAMRPEIKVMTLNEAFEYFKS
jgi:hypothetical protein